MTIYDTVLTPWDSFDWSKECCPVCGKTHFDLYPPEFGLGMLKGDMERKEAEWDEVLESLIYDWFHPSIWNKAFDIRFCALYRRPSKKTHAKQARIVRVETWLQHIEDCREHLSNNQEILEDVLFV